jgi:hypothetical protein
MFKSIGSGIVNFVVSMVNGVVNVGDRLIHAGSAIVANEFFLMLLTIAGFVALLKVR